MKRDHIPNVNLTVVIRDDAPFIHVQAQPSYRTVRVPLTIQQVELLAMAGDEAISMAILEPPAPGEE